jgi:hypothetical protein
MIHHVIEEVGPSFFDYQVMKLLNEILLHTNQYSYEWHLNYNIFKTKQKFIDVYINMNLNLNIHIYKHYEPLIV